MANQESLEKSIDRKINLAENDRLTENFEFTFAPPEPPEETVRVAIGTRLNDVRLTGATIEIDNKRQDNKSPFTYEITPGQLMIKAYITLQDGTYLEKDTTVIINQQTDKLWIDYYR